MRKLLCGTALLTLAACDLSPDLTLPHLAFPEAFKEASADAPEATVAPATDGRWKRFDEKAQIEEFAWWRMFDDAKLNALMDQAMAENPSLEIAIARVSAARALTDAREADLYPTASIGVGPERQRQSPESMKPNMPPGATVNVKPYTLYRAQGTITYDLDLFGQSRASARAASEDAKAESARYRAARLGLQAELAEDYFRVAALRQEQALLTRAVASRQATLAHVQQKLHLGAADALAASAAEADLAAAQAEAASVAQALGLAEHALAVVAGKPPAAATLEVATLEAPPPVVPAGLPSRLLERRPDVQSAERQIAAANERIGVARAGYFPDISLSAMGGFVSGDLSSLFSWSNRTWMIGPLAGTVLTQPIFEGGKIAAARAQSQADYESAVASYRQAVLTAFREVEDQLSTLDHTRAQAKAVADGLAAATRAERLAKQRFETGYSSHLEYLDAERTLLAASRSKTQLLGNQYLATVTLVKALGGSWQAPEPAASAPAVNAP